MKKNRELSRSSLFPLLNPWSTLSSLDKDLHSDMERWFDLSPNAEMTEKEDQIFLRIDIPGVKKDQVKIEVEDNHITVSGERSSKKEEKKEKSYFSESRYGSFLRTFALPTSIDENKVKAKYEDGVLEITIPKNGSAKSKTVAIQ